MKIHAFNQQLQPQAAHGKPLASQPQAWPKFAGISFKRKPKDKLPLKTSIGKNVPKPYADGVKDTLKNFPYPRILSRMKSYGWKLDVKAWEWKEIERRDRIPSETVRINPRKRTITMMTFESGLADAGEVAQSDLCAALAKAVNRDALNKPARFPLWGTGKLSDADGFQAIVNPNGKPGLIDKWLSGALDRFLGETPGSAVDITGEKAFENVMWRFFTGEAATEMEKPPERRQEPLEAYRYVEAFLAPFAAA